MTDIDTLHADLQRAQSTIAGPVPTIESAPDCGVTLIRGIAHNGKMQTEALVRELTGRDEEALARYKKVEELFDAVLAYGTERIGELDLSSLPIGDRQAYLRQLLIGERDSLYLAVARATYGDERKFPVKCTICNREQDLNLKISEDFKSTEVTKFEGSTFKYVTTKGEELEVRLATGSDQLEILKRDNISAAEVNTALLSQCILSFNGGVVVDPLNFARGLTMRDRQRMLTEMSDRQPSVDLTIKFDCFGCQEEQQASFGWLDFFRE